MSFKYDIIVEVKTGEIVPTIKDFENRVNGYMSDFGFDEKMLLVSKGPVGTIKSEVKLPQDTLDKMLTIIQDQFNSNELLSKFKVIELKPV
jgi:hypothetical protein